MKRMKRSDVIGVGSAAVLVFLAGCGGSRGADIAATGVAGDDAERSVASASEDSVLLDGKGESALQWKPAPVDGAGQVFDLCDDQQAIAAGLDGGDLTGDRVSLGIGCDAGGIRYGSLDQYGGLTLGTTDEFINSPTDPEIDGRADSILTLGYRSASIVDDAIRQIKGDGSDLVVLDSSLNHVDGSVYGLVVNLGDRLATHMTVSYLDEAYFFPLSLQPGEASPFVLRADHRLDPRELTIKADLSGQVDMTRSVLIYRVPGRWSGSASDIPAPVGLVDASEFGDEVRYYETTLGMAVPSDRPDLEEATRLTTISDPIAVVAFLDKGGRVVGLENAPIVVVGSQGRARPAASIEFGEMVTTGFLIPSEASDFVLQVGGVIK